MRAVKYQFLEIKSIIKYLKLISACQIGSFSFSSTWCIKITKTTYEKIVKITKTVTKIIKSYRKYEKYSKIKLYEDIVKHLLKIAKKLKWKIYNEKIIHSSIKKSAKMTNHKIKTNLNA